MRRLLPPLLSLVFAAAVYAESYTFRFAPVVDRPFGQTVTTTVTTKVDDDAPTTRVTTEKSVLRYRRAEGGYVLSASTTEGTVTVNGKDATDPVTKMVQGGEITLDLSAAGELRNVHGFDKVLKKIFSASAKDVPPEMQAALAKVLNEEALVNRVRAEWDGRISSFAGETVEIGDVFEAENSLSMPTGDVVTFYQTTTIAGRQKCGGAECLRIVFRYHTNPAALKNALDAVGKAIPGGMKTEGMTITGSGERIIDPRTMQIYSEINERTMHMPVTAPDGTKSMGVRTEKKEYSFHYSGVSK